MGSELEQEVDTAKGNITDIQSDVTDLSDITATGTTVNNIVHKDGTETITGEKSMTNVDNDIRVKTTPVATTSAVNQAYVESTVDGVNNLVHKSGNEIISGTKTVNILNAKYLGSHRVFCEHDKWTKIITNIVNNATWRDVQFNVMGIGVVGYDGSFKIHIPGNVSTTQIGKVYGGTNFTLSMIKAGYKLDEGSTSAGVIEIWISPVLRSALISISEIGTGIGSYGENVWDMTTITQDTEPDWANDYDGVIVGVGE